MVSTRKTLLGSTPLYFKVAYDSKTAQVILAAKESSNSYAINLLATSISQSILYAIADLGVTGEINLVTIPSSTSAIRRRGRDHIHELAAEVQKMLWANSVKSNLLIKLSQRKKLKDQSKLDNRQRMQNTYGMFEITTCENPQGAIFLIDDLITTGASILEGIRALFEAKITVTAAITACSVGRDSLIPYATEHL
jgi:predicted amidophosphoribosyltransferase